MAPMKIAKAAITTATRSRALPSKVIGAAVMVNVPLLCPLLCGQVVHIMCIMEVHTEEAWVALDARLFCQSTGHKEP